MSHLSHDTLWALAKRELGADETSAAEAHVSACDTCRAQLDDVKFAQQALVDLPPVPPMPDALARRVGAKLADEADRQLMPSLRSWWTSLLSPRLVLVGGLAALLVIAAAYVLTRPQAPAPPQPFAQPTPQPVVPSPVPAPVPPAPPKVAAKKLTVQIASAKKASASAKPAAKAQTLEEGAVVATETGGSVWMRLPDGTRAGVTGASSVKLATLEEKQLTLDVEKGSLAMVVPHREDRVLTVRAGEVEVKDLGTRFLVSRDVQRIVVAVEEGSVEVKTPGATKTVRAGNAVAWQNGALSSFAWEVTPPQKPDTASSVAKLNEEDDDTAPPEQQAPVQEEQPVAQVQPPDTSATPDEQWAAPPTLPKPVVQTPPYQAPPPPGHVDTAHPSRGSDVVGFSLKTIERRLQELKRSIEVVPFGDQREAAARQIAASADAGDCVGALARAERWLSEPPTSRANEAQLRRGVLLQKLRCLNRLGRTAEAEAVAKELER